MAFWMDDASCHIPEYLHAVNTDSSGLLRANIVNAGLFHSFIQFISFVLELILWHKFRHNIYENRLGVMEKTLDGGLTRITYQLPGAGVALFNW